MYKMVVIDIDGTLLTSQGKITDKTKEALVKAQEQGMIVVLASGRIANSTINYARNIGLNSYAISGNGSVITDIQSEEMIYTNCMSNRVTQLIVDICKENSISFNVYTLNEILTEKIEYNILFYSMQNRELVEEKKTKINICDDLSRAIKEKADNNVSKITICDKDESIFKSIIRKLRTINGIEILDVSHSSHKVIDVGSQKVDVDYYYTEVSKANVDKWNAIKFLADKLEINYEDVICIGDNANDIKMIENCGLGVFLDNAAPVYKEKAKYVAPSNDDDGIVDVLEKYVFNK